MARRRRLLPRLALAWLLGTTLIAPHAGAASKTSGEQAGAGTAGVTQQLAELDQRLAELAPQHYRALAGTRAPHIETASELATAVKRLMRRNDAGQAATLIHRHRDKIDGYLPTDALAQFNAALLTARDTQTAEWLLQQAESAGDDYSAATLAYQHAVDHYQRGHWRRALELLEDRHSDLDTAAAHHALLITGGALQQQKQHRRAVAYYQRIPAESSDFARAQLNIAGAFLRQDWWTDGQIALNRALETIDNNDEREMVNRLYLTLGYLYLHKAYYRDARESFREIELDSRYLNRALLGLGLAAAGQEDYVGALNAFSRLNQRTQGHLSVEETYVLIPFLYEKLDRPATAKKHYERCINHYQLTLDYVDTALIGRDHVQADYPRPRPEVLIIDNIHLELSRDPSPLFNDLERLRHFTTLAGTAQPLAAATDQLLADYQRSFNDFIDAQLDQRRQQLHSYLNQCRYGLAALFDKHEASAQ